MIKHKDLVKGLLPLGPAGVNKHSIKHGWPIATPPIENNQLHIWLEEDLTIYKGQLVEIEKYIEHYGDEIENVIFYSQEKNIKNMYPKLNWVWYPKFNYITTENAIAHKDTLEKNFTFAEKTQKFLCLNRARRTHRDKVCAILQKQYTNKCLWSYMERGIASPDPDDLSLEDYTAMPMYADVDIDSTNIFSHKMMFRNLKNLLYMKNLFNKTSFSLVTETRANLPFDFFSEKTWQCFIALHPALYVSNKHHVKMLREWGFDVFDDIFDHGYDEVDDNIRIETLFELNKNVLTNGIDITESVKSRLIKNQQYYLSDFIKVFPSL
ncbi:MAG TPA: hypothetical protein DCG42_09290 [Maribacter sp.]|nr:hypothetical protein [Maribacter sp.]